MGTTLSGTKPKDTYQGLIKTTDNGAVGSSLKTLTDGAGNDIALSVSTTGVRAETLQIGSAAPSSSTTVLVLNGVSGAVEKRTLPVFETVTASLSGSSDPTLTISDSGGASTAIQFKGGNGISVSQASKVITISRSVETLETLNASNLTISSTDSGKILLLDANSVNGGTVVLPTAAAGLFYRIRITNSSTTAMKITTADAGVSGVTQYFYGKVTVQSTTNDKIAMQTVPFATAAAAEEDYDTISIDSDASTTGGLEGDSIDLYCEDGNKWLVTAQLSTTAAAPSLIATITAA